jgi:fimbrial isopeptide formation D2 family protein/uncharacterized repeat protein (TIGR01451 family)
MKNKNRQKVLSSNTFLAILAIVILTTAITNTAMPKSLYVIADILGASESRTQPVQAYDIGVDGTLTFQAQLDIPHSMLGAVGMAIDADSGYLFITYEAGNDIQLLDPYTLSDAGRVRAPDAHNLAGIKYDHDKGLLYTVDRRSHFLYVYNWYPETTTLTHVPGSPFTLENAHAYGIALDEIDDLLYVSNASNTVTVYRTSDWKLVDTITLSRIAISIAVDVMNGFLYTGGGYAGNFFLTQYHLATDTEKEVQVEPDAGVMGLRVDPDTGLVYMSTGRDTVAGGDNLLVYDKALNQIDIIHAIGNPTDLAIPIRDIGYNPLNLTKQVIRGANTSADFDDMMTVEAGSTYTYGISFQNNNDFSVTDVTIVDTLPDEVAFVMATDDGVNGHYNFDENTGKQTFTWIYQELPPKTSTLLEITVQVNSDIAAGTIITNSVTINSNQTPPSTTGVDVIVTSNDLNLKKEILGVPAGQIAQVDTNDIITYIIEFDNKDNDFPVTNVTVVDELPKNVTFISADGGKSVGKYDDKSHTYTWRFDSLEHGATVHLELDVLVNPGLALGTVITNVVSISSNETSEASTRVDAMTYYKPLNITKKAMDKEGNELDWVDPGDRFTYKICFDNNNNQSGVNDVLIVDILPDEVTFVMTDDGKATGKYDAKAHTYTWTYGPMNPGMSDCVELVVDVNENTPLDTIIANTVTIDSNETLPATAVHELHIGEILWEMESLTITPNVLRRNGTSPNILAVVQLPEGITRDDIETNEKPKLYYLNQDSDIDNFILIGEGNLSISGTENSPRIHILFNRAELMNTLYGYGTFTLRVELKLKTGRTYFGHANVHLTRFAGD